MINAELRRLAIGGSEVGALFGVDGERDAFSVWAAKKGGLPPSPPTDRMLIGKALERGVVELYEHVTKRKTDWCDETRIHPTRPWMIYTPDAFCRDERRGVDAKVVAWDQRRKWGVTADEIPERIQMQCWYYMAATDYDVWDVAALLGDGLPRVYEIERNREAERVVLARCEEFYRRNLLGNEIPELGNSGVASVWLQQAFPSHKQPLRQPTPEEMELLAEYTRVRVKQKRYEIKTKPIEEERDRLENAIKLAIGDGEGLIWADGKFTWRNNKDKQITDWQLMAEGLMNQFMPDKAKRAELTEFYTRTVPGARPIRFVSNELLDLSEAA